MSFALRRRWWLVIPWSIMAVGMIVGLLWLVLSGDEDNKAIYALLLLIVTIPLCAASVLDQAGSVWVKLDEEGVWEPTMFGWVGIRWGEIQRVERRHDLVTLASPSRRIVIHLDVFVDRAAILDVLTSNIPSGFEAPTRRPARDGGLQG